MKQLRLVVNESCCDNVAGSKPTNSELCKWLIYFLRGICDVALTIAMSLQYLLNDSTKKENCRKQSVSYNICRVSQQAWALGNQSSGILSQQKTRHRQTSITTNVAGISYQTEKARPTNHSSPDEEDASIATTEPSMRKRRQSYMNKKNSKQIGLLSRCAHSLLMWLCLVLFTQHSHAAGWVNDIPLSTFTSGTQGQIIWGAAADDKSGSSVSGGDVNGDGYGDVIIGSPFDDLNGNKAGAAHILFGHSAPFNTVDLQSFTPSASAGYKYNGEVANNFMGSAVTMLGDMNGDGIKDYAIGCPQCSSTSPTRTANGKVYVIYSRRYNATFTQYGLDSYPTGTGGFRIIGATTGDIIGSVIAPAGDFNRDGRADLLVGVPAKSVYGAVYLILGQTNANTVNIDLDPSQFFASSSNGFRINGGGVTTVYSKVGQSVSAAGDVNGDGYDDIVIGAPATAYGGRTACGAAVVIFGHGTGVAFNNIVLSTGFTLAMGFPIYGALDNDELGTSVGSMRNMNGDSYSDLILGAPNVNSVFGATSQSGSVWVYYGRSTSAAVDLSSMNSLGVVFYNLPNGANLGYAVAGVGDVNGDGYDDFAFSAPTQAVDNAQNAGVVYVIYGKASAFSTPQNMNNFASGSIGYRVLGYGENTYYGYSISSAGDYNQDGLRDIVVGAYGANANGRTAPGISYVLFGTMTGDTRAPTLNPSVSPSASPSVSPSKAPSLSPSVNPTVNPSVSPSLAPSVAPSVAPSASPTLNPSVSPTVSPSVSPSLTPTVTPSLKPSVSPSGNPTANPSVSPSVSPTVTPSNTPSVSPSLSPTVSPSINPSVAPTVSPSLTPSRSPSLSPSVNPTTSPSASPSLAPSLAPSVAPSASPSISPTVNPSVNPTANPSLTPSMSPSLAPSKAPSLSPSLSPTVSPSVNPSLTPSAAPSIAPSRAPSVNPTANPTIKPSACPSAQPSYVPTSSPTLSLSALTSNGNGKGFVVYGAALNHAASVVAGPGDVNGDGFPDMLVGAPGAGTSSAGVVYVLFGKGATVSYNNIDLANFVSGPSAGYKITANAAGWFGTSVSGLGDVNGDGMDDFIVGAPYTTANSLANAGVAYVFYGKSCSVTCPDIAAEPFTAGAAGFRVLGSIAGGNLGQSVSYVGDFNGDGRKDIIVGCPYYYYSGQVTGAAFIIFGRTTAATADVNIQAWNSGPSMGMRILGDGTSWSSIGLKVSAAGLLNRDSYADVLIGAPTTSFGAHTQCGAVLVLFGRGSSYTDVFVESMALTNTTGFVIYGAHDYDGLGGSLTPLAHFDSDSYADIAIGAPSATDMNGVSQAGYVVILYGRALPKTLTYLDLSVPWPAYAVAVSGGTVNIRASRSIAAGDFNKDGYTDLVIGVPSTSGNPGATYVLFGQASKRVDANLLSFSSSADQGFAVQGMGVEQSGMAVSSLFDFNGDGFDDLIIGSPFGTSLTGTAGAGRSYVLYGSSNGAPSVSPSLVPSVNPTLTPTAGPSAALTVGPTAGPTFVLNDLFLSNFAASGTGFPIYGGLNNYYSGYSVSGGGDLNGDGRADIIIGSKSFSGGVGPDAGAVHVVYGTGSSPTAPVDLALSAFTTAQSGFFLIGGTGDLLGFSVKYLGDVNSDSLGDFAVGAPGANSGAGIVYIMYGCATTCANLYTSSWVTGARGFRILGSSLGDAAGTVVASAGDFNGDGIRDILVGAPNYAYTGVVVSGAVYVIFGRAGSSPEDISLSSFTSSSTTGMGFFGSTIGDLVASGGSAAGPGNVNINLDTIISGVGTVLSGAGDFNGDGLDDIIVGMPTSTMNGQENCGVVAVIFGRAANFYDLDFTTFVSSSTEGFLVVGAAADTMLGVSVTTLGYFDSDNKKDIAISAGASVNSGEGYVLVLYGRAIVAGTIDLASAIPGTFGGFYIIGFLASDAASPKVVSNAGDVNGDSIGDLLVGIPLSDATYSDAGMTFVIYGRATRYTSLDLTGFQATSTTGYRVNGGAAGDYSGFALSAAGDVNGDGLVDFLVGAYLADPATRNNAGITYVIYGTRNNAAPSARPTLSPSVSPSLLPSVNPTVLPSAQPSIQPSLQPSRAPSLNPSLSPTQLPSLSPSVSPSVNLWVPDISISSFTSGSTGQIILGATGGDHSGTSVSGGDINGDGYADVIVGAPDNSESGATTGAVYLLFGHSSPFSTVDLAPLGFGPSAATGLKYRGSAEYDRIGRAVAALGDINGDGVKDYAIGCPFCSAISTRAGNGIVYVIFGRLYNATFAIQTVDSYTSGSQGFRIYGAVSQDAVGTSIAAAGDFNKDGYADLLVGAPDKATYGYVYLILGKSSANTINTDLAAFISSTTRGIRITGGSGPIAAFAQIGKSLAAAGDVNGDGFDDILIGAPGTTYGGRTSCGAAVVIFGHNDPALFVNIDLSQGVASTVGFYLYGAAANDNFGFSVGLMKNMNGDSYPDFIIGAPNPSANVAGTSVGGSVWVYYGRSTVSNVDMNSIGSLGVVFKGLPTTSRVGLAVAGLGDINGDGFDDFAMSAPSQTVGGVSNVGVVYVFYGKSSAFTTLQDLSIFTGGAQGYRVIGNAMNSYLGYSLSSAGDYNKDGLKDIVVGAYNADAGVQVAAGISYVLFGISTVLSVAPSAAPSLSPSVNPTLTPTRSPSLNPSASPSAVPSATPTVNPSINPTVLPSIQPSIQPSVKPSANPSLSPSINPTAQPSFSVSVSPSNNLWVPDIPLATFTSGSTGQIIWGAATGDRCGTSVSGGDVNGDGYSDVVVSAAENDESIDGAGAVYALFGHSAPFSTVDLTPVGFVQSATTGLKYRGFEQNNKVGRAVAVVGDINGDGVKDYAIGCPYCGIDVRTGNGAVFVLFGRRFNESFAIQTLFSYTTGSVGFRIYGESGSDGAGASIAAAGDFNKDGYADLLVGAPDQQAGAGYVYLILGKSNANTADIHLASFAPSSTRGFKVTGGNGATATFSQIGRSMSAAGDVNGDTFDDFIIGAPGTAYGGRTGCGAAVVIFGHGTGAPFANIDLSLGVASTVGFNLYGAATNDNFGFSVGVMKNMNGDSYPDFVIGAPNTAALAGSTSAGGSVWLYYGRSTFSTVDFDVVGGIGVLFKGLSSNSRLGYAVAGLGDINGDGLDDFAMSAPSQNYGGNGNVGVLYVFYGKVSPFTTVQDLSVFVSGTQGYRVIGNAPDAFLGNSLSSAGDYNKDGLKDIVVGAYNADANGRIGAGLSYVLFGISTFPSVAPSVAPSAVPSLSPSVSPTLTPTRNPSTAPSASPSAVPSTNPTLNPSLMPSVSPSLLPSVSPTFIPSRSPSANPSATPSVVPTVDPTVNPTLAPSVISSTAVPTAETVDRYSNALTSAQGFNILGAADGDNLGIVVANVGDISGDGIDDLAMAAPNFDVGNFVDAGAVYILYGNRTRPVSDIDLLNFRSGHHGFRILGPHSNSFVGSSISVIQNFNGDGAKHILVGARSGVAHGPSAAGSIFVVKAYPYEADVNLSSPSFASQGFSISGEMVNDYLGNAVSAGDFNNDGSTDLLLSGLNANRDGAANVGVAYVLLGRTSSNHFTDIQLANFVTSTTWGLRMVGGRTLDLLGAAIAAAGDINDDGFADVVVSASGALLPNGLTSVGIVYLVFGTNDFSHGDLYTNADFTRNGHGFRILGSILAGRFGFSIVTSIDVNSDGRLDFLVGAAFTSSPNSSGSLYVIYGRNASAVLNDVYMSNLTVSTGYRIKGTANGRLGSSVAAAGDVNGDGIQDFVVGAPQTIVAQTNAGIAYVIYGTRNELRWEINLAQPLPRSVGFRLLGTSVNMRLGYSVSAAGDFNGDGLADIISGNYLASSTVPNRQTMGTVTVLFGYSNNPTGQPTARPTVRPTVVPSVVPRLMSPSDIDLTYLTPSQGFRIEGALSGDFAGSAIRKLTDINGDGVDELMIYSQRHPFLSRSLPGATYVFYGNRSRHSVSDMDLVDFKSGPMGFLIGGSANSQIGFSLGEVRGFFGDNNTDIVLGGPFDSTVGNQAGIVYVIRGAAYDRDVDLTNATSAPGLRIYGPEANARLGTAVDTARDFNGDGVNDLIISAPSASSSTLYQCGAVYVIFGKVRSAPCGNITLATFVSSPTTGLRIWGAGNLNQFGWSLGSAFDVNNDGKDDIFAGAYTAESTQGVVYVIFGQSDPLADLYLSDLFNSQGYRIVGALAGDRMGISATCVRDVNGDGRPDFILGASTASRSGSQQGVVYVLYGSDPADNFPDIYLVNFVAGVAGFKVIGENAANRLGTSVSSAGDVNGDGVPDFLLGAINAEPYKGKASGIAYVIYGTHTPIGDIYLNDTLPGVLGFRILGEVAGSKLGTTVAVAGDVNNDGYDDVLIGAPQSNAVTGRSTSGTTYVVYGFSNKPTTAPTSAPTVAPTRSPSAVPSVVPTTQPTIQTLVDLRTLPSSSNLGYQITGEHAADSSGSSVAAAGDLNRDGLQDFLLSATGYDQNSVADTGIVYVLYGQLNNASTLDLRNFTTGAHGFRIVGGTNGEMLGRSVSSAGDFDGDGYPDIMVSTRYVGGTTSYGVYVFLNLGRAPVVADVSVQAFTTGSEGFVIYGTATDNAGLSMSPAGDVNHDGVDDIIVGASVGVAFTGAPQTGIAYIIFGKRATVFGDIHLSTFISGPTGFRVIGVAAGNLFAYSVSRAGDVNGDGIDDVIIGARNVIVAGAAGAGSAYVIFGHTNAFSFADIYASNHTSGYYIPGIEVAGKTGVSVSGAGDVNGDGIADVIVGSSGGAGKAHVIFGQLKVYNSLRVIDLNALCATSGAGFCISGAVAGQNLGRVVKSAGDINADGFDDLFVCAQGATEVGFAYVFYGHSTATSFANIDVSTFFSGPQGFVVTYGQPVIGTGHALGDVNGDGVDDIIIAVSSADFPGRIGAGVSYVIYGRKVYPATSLAPTTHPTQSPTKIPTRAPTIVPTASPTQAAGDIRLPLGNDGTRGVKITGRLGAVDSLGYSVSGAGDMDGDGCDEMLISAVYAQTGDGLANGIVYVIFGRSNLTSSHIDMDSFVSGVHGICIMGYQTQGNLGATVGFSVNTAGDVNGDGLADIILGAPGFNPFGQRTNAGAAFVVFGARNLSKTGDIHLQDLNGYNGFAIWGRFSGDKTGYSVASAGDWDGDGLDDIIIGSPYVTLQTVRVGAACVVFSRRSVSNYFANIDLLHLTIANGKHIVGPSGSIAYMGYAVALAGDVNGDGKPDVIIGAPQQGTAYVVYGNVTSGTVSVDTILIDGTGFKIFDETINSRLGITVCGAGDVNDDGIDDILIGNPYGNPATVLVVYGSDVHHALRNVNFTAAKIEASRGFAVAGPYSFGAGVSRGGDLNGDGVGDLLIGAPTQNSYGLSANGAVYGIYGNKTMGSRTIDSTTLRNTEMGFRIVGSESYEGIGNAVDTCDFNGDGVPDIVFGAAAAGEDAGGSYVVLGTSPPPTRSPTVIPTVAPTLSPSSAPTLIPSTVPTVLPSTSPSVRPSTNPTADPSSGPTLTPSGNPSEAPSVSPSVDPSITPTVMPSVQPSFAPSVSSTVGPSIIPTMTPSVNPSAALSISSSLGPSVNPSTGLSASPSVDPSVNPSVGPSASPSINPTFYPTFHPSLNPSVTPINNPTAFPTTAPSINPSTIPSAVPVVGSSVNPSVDPTAVPSLLPTMTPSVSPSWGPSVHPSQGPSVQQTAEPTFVSSVDPSATPSITFTVSSTVSPSTAPTPDLTAPPSAHPSTLPTMLPSSQPSGRPTSQPTAQPSRQPSSQPSSQPTSIPSAAPSKALVPGEWATEIGNKTALSVVAPVNDVLWACGSSLEGAEGAPSCLVANTETGAVLTRYKFPWDAITSIVCTTAFNSVYLTGRVTTTAVSSNIAVCAINEVPLSCAVQGFPNINILGASFNAVALKLVYVGLNSIHASATLYDTGTSTATNYVYTNPNMQSITLSRVQSASSFIGSFVAGTGARTAGATNFIVMGWLRADTGQLSAAMIGPTSGSIVNSAELVNAMTLDSTGPDSFIGGSLQLSDSAGVNAYVVRCNALYRSVVYAARYRARTVSTSRRMLSTTAVDSFTSTKLTAMVLVSDLSYMAIEQTSVTEGGVTLKSLSVIKARTLSGSILKQVLITSEQSASLTCTDISFTGLNLNLACSAQYQSSFKQSVLLSADPELTFSQLPTGFIRSTRNDTLLMEKIPMQAFALPMTTTVTNVASERYVYTDSEHKPSLKPTAAPTVSPSHQPSSAPSGQPSSSPTAAPSVSSQPSSHPSTSGPTGTYKPSVEPTVRPTTRPSVTSTVKPSVRPSRAPSVRPTMKPSSRPTPQPSDAPTANPTRVPIAPARTPTRSPAIVKTVSPTRLPSVVPTIPEVPLSENTTSKSRSDDITVVIGASLGGAFGLLFLLYVARKSLVYVHKERSKQKKLDDYFKRLDLLKQNSNDTAVVIPMMMVPEKYKKRGAYINTSPTNSNHGRSPTARHLAKKRQGNSDSVVTPTASVDIPDLVPEESADARSQSDSLSDSYNISSFYTSEEGSAQNAQQELYNSSPALHPASRENLLEEGRIVGTVISRSVSPVSDLSAGAVSTSSRASSDTFGDASSDDSGGNSVGDELNNDKQKGMTIVSGDAAESGADSGEEESIELSSMGSEASADSLEEDAEFQDFMQAMSEELNSSEVSSQDDASAEFSV